MSNFAILIILLVIGCVGSYVASKKKANGVSVIIWAVIVIVFIVLWYFK